MSHGNRRNNSVRAAATSFQRAAVCCVCLRFAPDPYGPRGPLDQAEHFPHNQKASVATLRRVFGTARNAVRLRRNTQAEGRRELSREESPSFTYAFERSGDSTDRGTIGYRSHMRVWVAEEESGESANAHVAMSLEHILPLEKTCSCPDSILINPGQKHL